ncbi:MAG TPA: hydrogenase expression/formation C-terminal domain-containing protein [Wenzhouxiangellaceae bacterium]|nr:hydrogenase expression/formation C-terminal domain-containing protein [Wenzhouxiangellaceae bacterium]
MNQAIPLMIKSAPGKTTTIGGGVQAMAHEILSHLERLHETGETAAIDLKSLPMAPDEFHGIKKMLGQGEIDLTLELDGPTRIRETAYAGVWWIQHTGKDGRILAEFIEITRFPDFLSAQPDQIADAVRQLRDQLQERLQAQSQGAA